LESNKIGFIIIGSLHKFILNLQVLLETNSEKASKKKKWSAATKLTHRPNAARAEATARAAG
jgi:hypothetical protein